MNVFNSMGYGIKAFLYHYFRVKLVSHGGFGCNRA